MEKEQKEKLMEQKHEAMKKLGVTPPKDSEENKRRAFEAHGY